MKVRQAVLCVALLLTASSSIAAEPTAGRVALPKPRTEGTTSVETALHHRRSLRTSAATPLTLTEVGQLCWAAQGITDAKGHRTTPSAHATYPLQVYVLAGAVGDLARGVYRYVPDTHGLELITSGDHRLEFERRGVGQTWIARAPAIFVISGSVSKMAALGDRGAQFMAIEAGLAAIEAGLAAQGFFLQAEALGLGSTYVGGFRPRGARDALNLPAGEEVLAVLPVGHNP
jgi:SagB-type dehydrogenase family enzyme